MNVSAMLMRMSRIAPSTGRIALSVVIDIVQNWLEQPDCPPPEEFAPWALNLWRSIMGRWKELGDAWEHTLDHKNA